ncbi:hypothetical protein A0H76_851 [Hepatospora eriocheir]|uniref:Uncharacterized protein n=1 Tax=Hepatospora eriocheir TaxID=1081669 RepID=A0A1X0QI41_9MICR|nr:hypothetical protein A0H76_851 [Hepatospora eriocheir]
MNQLCFIDFDYLFNQNKNALATFLLYEKDSNDPERYYYVLDNNQIMNCFLFPLKYQSEVTRVFNAVPLSSPTIFVASSELNNLFAELYWVENINQLVHDSIDLNMNKYPFNFVDNCNVAYCKEIVTMNDYLSVNCDLPESLNAVNLFSSSVSNLNLERFEKYLQWIVIDDAEPRIVFKDSLIFNDFNYVITINDVVIRKEKKKVEGFFEKLENFLMEKYFSKNSVDYCEVAAKVLSFKISNSYKANKFEIVDVFASFLAKSVFRKTEIVNDLNIAIARAVEFFTVLQEIVANDRECQEHFMDLLEEYILGSNFKQKYLLFASYIHLFQERKVIKRKVLLQHVGAIQGKI